MPRILAQAGVGVNPIGMEQTVIDRAHDDGALTVTGRKNVLSSAHSRQVAAEQIAHDIRALALSSTNRGGGA